MRGMGNMQGMMKQMQKMQKKIWMDDRQEIQHNLEVQTGRYEEIFKNEFVLEILRYCNEARERLKSINLELKNLKFKDRIFEAGCHSAARHRACGIF